MNNNNYNIAVCGGGIAGISAALAAAREGKNPATGEAISIPATKVPAFKAGKALKEAVAK